eukprot:PhF_6_TR7967/c0_g1_i3/m.12111
MLVLRRLIRVRRDLKLIIMSATLQSEMFSSYFGNCPIVNVDQAIHPIEVYHLEDIYGIAKAQGKTSSIPTFQNYKPLPPASSGRPVDDTLLVFVVRHVVNVHLQDLGSDGSVLVFLPGWNEIQRARELLESSTDGRRLFLVQLHSAISPEDQMLCFQKAPPGRIKVILATNIAET